MYAYILITGNGFNPLSVMTKEQNQHTKVLNEILTTQNFEKLEPLTCPEAWTTLEGQDKELLALLVVMHGEKLLEVGDKAVLEKFQLANKIAPDCPLVLYRQALAFSRQIHNLLCLKLAVKIFENVVHIYPGYFDAWHDWAKTLVAMGSLEQDSAYFEEAMRIFSDADKHLDAQSQEKAATFHHNYALALYFMGRLSGEPLDIKHAIQKLQQAARCGLHSPEFLCDLGNAYMELSQLVNKPEMVIDAAEKYWKSIKLSPTYLEGWVNLASSLQTLYQLSPQDAYFVLANESFEQAAQIDPQNATLWIKWGQLLTFRGRIFWDAEKLRESCDRFETADLCEPNHPIILSAWGEALLQLGSQEENLAYLNQAKDKILKSLELEHDIARVWCLYGNCLFEIGKYFGEAKFCQEAIEKFRCGLKLDPNDHLLWYGLAQACFAVGQLNDDLAYLHEASQCCAKVIEKGGQHIPQLWNDWGLTLMKISQATDEKRYIKAAIAKFEQALRLRSSLPIKDPIESDWLYNYGCALEFLGDFDEDISWYEKASQMYTKALELDPIFHLCHYNLANNCAFRGELAADLELHYEAIKHYEAYLASEPEDDAAWNDWGLTLLNLADMINDPSRREVATKYYAEAESKFRQSLALGNQSSLYNMACLYSLVGNYDASLHYLEKGDLQRMLPPLDELLHDEWLEGVRHTEQFREFLSQIRRNDM